jgi:hypothetical protein
MRVYIWHPVTLKSNFKFNLCGHSAIQIEDQYFSFYPNINISEEIIKEFFCYPNIDHELWKTPAQDEEGLGKADEIIDIDVDRIFHPYILELYNPSIAKNSIFSYRGMGGRPYNLSRNNCCHQVARFIDRAIAPYLIDIFGNPQKNTYWLNYQDEQCSQARYEKLKELYCNYNPHTGSNDLDICTNNILCNWVLYKLYKMAMFHKYGPHVAQQIIIKKDKGLAEQPDCILWGPTYILYYARFAKSVVEYLSGKVPAIPWLYTVEWDNYNGQAKPRDVSQLNNFQREDLGFKNLNGLRAIETRYFRYFQ